MSSSYYNEQFDLQPFIPDEYLEMERIVTKYIAFYKLHKYLLEQYTDGLTIKERDKCVQHLISNLSQAHNLSREQIWHTLFNELPPLPVKENKAITLLKSIIG